MCAVAVLPLHSQNNRSSRTSTAQAVMQIRANVVPMVLAPAPNQNARAETVVTYNLPATQVRLSIVEEVRPLAAPDKITAPAGTQLRTVTIVAK